MTQKSRTQRYSLLFVGLAVLALGPITSKAALASQEYLTESRKPFSLKATINDGAGGRGGGGSPQGVERPQLSRDDVAIAPPEAMPPLQRFDLGAEQANQLPPQQRIPEAPKEQPASSMIEYGVDWSRWVSQLADHWFYNLKALEDQSGLQFHTVRPCLLKFTCYPNGQIAEITLKQTSGVPLYDQLQAQALLSCQPIHPFPQGTQRTSFTLVQGWESHPRKLGERDYKPGSFGRGFPIEVVKQWMNSR